MFNLQANTPTPFIMRQIAWAGDFWGKMCSPGMHVKFYTDKGAARPCVDRVLGWNATRVVPCHGTIVEAPDLSARMRVALHYLY